LFGVFIGIEALAMGINFVDASIPSKDVARGVFVPQVRKCRRLANSALLTKPEDERPSRCMTRSRGMLALSNVLKAVCEKDKCAEAQVVWWDMAAATSCCTRPTPVLATSHQTATPLGASHRCHAHGGHSQVTRQTLPVAVAALGALVMPYNVFFQSSVINARPRDMASPGARTTTLWCDMGRIQCPPAAGEERKLTRMVGVARG
jgi:hypothetical protein